MKKEEREKQKKEVSEKEKLKKEAENYKKERDEYLESLKRAKAELINYKKDEMQRMGDFARKERESLIMKFLEILDNFERAATEAEKREEDGLIDGFLKIKEQMEEMLSQEGVEKIGAIGEEFDPYYHEAIETIEKEDEESGRVVEEVQKGYLLNGKVIRPSKVKVVK